MAKLGFLKRLIKEDFKSTEQEMIGKVAFILNPAMEAITNALTSGLTIEDNFNGNVKEIVVTVDAAGLPTSSTSFKSGLKLPVKNLIVTRAINLSNSTAYPTSHPFINFTDNGGQITINQVSGLQANNKYQLRVIYLV